MVAFLWVCHSRLLLAPTIHCSFLLYELLFPLSPFLSLLQRTVAEVVVEEEMWEEVAVVVEEEVWAEVAVVVEEEMWAEVAVVVVVLDLFYMVMNVFSNYVFSYYIYH